MPLSQTTSAAHSRFRRAPQFWEKRGPLSLLLWPLSYLYGLVLRIRNLVGDIAWGRQASFPVPIIIVGNIRVGGTGKTPIVIALAEQLAQHGWKPGIISRGYGSQTQATPVSVNSQSDPTLVGDEPVLMATRTHNRFPIWVHPQRKRTINALLEHSPAVNVIISDDGLQHSGLSRWTAREGGRDIELVVRDARGEGNGFLLPAGPLRESAQRDRDATVMTGSNTEQLAKALDYEGYFLGRRAFMARTSMGTPYQLCDHSRTQTLADIARQYSAGNLVAVAALGNPQRFFSELQQHGLPVKGIPLADHATYTPAFFTGLHAACILITEKDAVKCAGIDDERIWVVPQHVTLSAAFVEWIESILHRPNPRGYTL